MRNLEGGAQQPALNRLSNTCSRLRNTVLSHPSDVSITPKASSMWSFLADLLSDLNPHFFPLAFVSCSFFRTNWSSHWSVSQCYNWNGPDASRINTKGFLKCVQNKHLDLFLFKYGGVFVYYIRVLLPPYNDCTCSLNTNTAKTSLLRMPSWKEM